MREYDQKNNVVARRLKPTPNIKEECKILTFEGYWSYVQEYKADNPHLMWREIYHHTEKVLEVRFGLAYYSSYESFQKSLYKYINALKN